MRLLSRGRREGDTETGHVRPKRGSEAEGGPHEGGENPTGIRTGPVPGRLVHPRP